MDGPWPPGGVRIPDEEWTRAPVDSLATKYDSVERHGWYDNLDPTVEELAALLRPGSIMVDYSGGTGILIDRLLPAIGDRDVGIVNVDSSPKFLRLCVEKFRAEPRVAFRLLRFIKERKRLQFLDEALALPDASKGVDVIASANAIHLYSDLQATLLGWRRVLSPTGRVLVQSGNIVHSAPRGRIIDDTVHEVHEAARLIVGTDPSYAAYRNALDVPGTLAAHDALRRRFFLPPRPIAFYEDEFRRAGFVVESVRTRRVVARTEEWLEFLRVYHEGILGWVGGSKRVEGREPTDDALRDRLRLMGDALRVVLGGNETFDASWTYLRARPST